jgi:hypothetical protein
MKQDDVLTILQYSWDPSNCPPKDLKFKKCVLVLKFKKCMVRRFVHFKVLCCAKYRYGEKIFHRTN